MKIKLPKTDSNTMHIIPIEIDRLEYDGLSPKVKRRLTRLRSYRVSIHFRNDNVQSTAIYFRGKIYFIISVNVDTLGTIDISSRGRTYYISTEIFSKAWSTILVKYGNKSYYDPRTFGRCHEESGLFATHEFNFDSLNCCGECGVSFADCISPVIAGRKITWLNHI